MSFTYEVWCDGCDEYVVVYQGTTICPHCDGTLDFEEFGPCLGDPDALHDRDR